MERKEKEERINEMESENELQIESQSSTIPHLPELVMYEILNYLSIRELLRCRRVSRYMAYISDWVLKHKRRTLVFSRDGGNEEESENKKIQILTSLKLFTGAKKVIVQYRWSLKQEACMQLEELLVLCGQNLKEVKELEMYDQECTDNNCHLIGECFPKLERIAVGIALSEEQLTKLFLALNNLKSVSVRGNSGVFFQSIRNKIESIKLYDANDVIDFPRMDSLKEFKMTPERSEFGATIADPIIATIETQMPNLVKLTLEGLYFEDFQSIHLQSLEKLKLIECDIDAVTPGGKMETVTSLVLDCSVGSEYLRPLFSMFPKLQNLKFETGYFENSDLDFIDVVRELRSIKKLQLKIFVDPLEKSFLTFLRGRLLWYFGNEAVGDESPEIDIHVLYFSNSSLPYSYIEKWSEHCIEDLRKQEPVSKDRYISFTFE